MRRGLSEFFDRWALAVLIVGIVLFIALIALAPQAISLLHRETVIDTVVRSERITNGESGKYLVFGEREVYQNTDVILVWKLNSSDFYRDIEVGKTYRFRVIGWRIPLFSLYRNSRRQDDSSIAPPGRGSSGSRSSSSDSARGRSGGNTRTTGSSGGIGGNPQDSASYRVKGRRGGR